MIKNENGNIENIKVEGRTGTWYAIDKEVLKGRTFYIMESEQHGDEAEWIVVNTKFEEVNEDLSYHIIHEM